jgi:hypothetical protein
MKPLDKLVCVDNGGCENSIIIGRTYTFKEF